jgi:hypothetical protein
LEASYVRQRAEQKQKSAALVKRRSLPLSAPKRLERKNLSNPDLRAFFPSTFETVGRRDAPGATDDAANMDGTFYSSEALMMDASAASKVSHESSGVDDSLHGLQTPVARAGSPGMITPVGSEASLGDISPTECDAPPGGRGGVRSLGDMPGKEA